MVSGTGLPFAKNYRAFPNTQFPNTQFPNTQFPNTECRSQGAWFVGLGKAVACHQRAIQCVKIGWRLVTVTFVQFTASASASGDDLVDDRCRIHAGQFLLKPLYGHAKSLVVEPQ